MQLNSIVDMLRWCMATMFAIPYGYCRKRIDLILICRGAPCYVGQGGQREHGRTLTDYKKKKVRKVLTY